MKKIFCLLGIGVTILSCHQSESEKSHLRFVIDRNMNERQIEDLISTANSVDIKLDVHVESYNKQGKIKKIYGDVKFGGTGSATFGSDNLGKIIITQDMNTVNGGFSIVVKNKWI